MAVDEEVRHEDPRIGGERHKRRAWRKVSAAATRQKGLVTTADLAQAAITPRQRERALRESRLHPVGRGVYSVGHQS